ncbi:MAG: hypothetical protein J6K75_07865 [Erysipelotrichaceae bacterium]|nr:hypothetical protein [Erysipelotrichaceae bacterium]
MNRRFLKLLFIISWIPFTWPLLMWTFETFMNISSWGLVEFIVLYSFVYWPTYLAGLFLMIVTVFLIKKK